MENEVLLNEVLLTAREAAAEPGVHVGTVHNAFQEKRLPFVALYGRNLISRADLDAYKQRTRPSGEKPKGRPRELTEALGKQFIGTKSEPITDMRQN